jgi:hypothetical protein
VALIDVPGRRIQGKIVYYGPGFGGKTTNLRYVGEHLRDGAGRGLRAIADESGRTIFRDVLPLELGSLLGFSVRYDLYTVPGQPDYGGTRTAVLTGADGVVFVADAAAGRLPNNRRSLEELAETVARQGKDFATLPLVLQYNKMDLPDALSVAELDGELNAAGVPRFPAVAVVGAGVAETLRAICAAVTRRL